jgi:beta-N-acetylhexosaminidase
MSDPRPGTVLAAAPAAVRRAVLGVLLPGFTGTTPPAWLLAAARDGLAGVVLFAQNTPDPATTAALTRALHAAAPGLLVTLDEEGGDVSRLEAADGSSLPGAAALGVVDDEGLTREAGEALGRLLAAVGVDLDLAPVLDVASDPRNPVIGVRSFGPDPDLVARHARAFASGLRAGGVGACAKHFPGHGDTAVDSHLALPVVDVPLEVLRARELVPFAALAGRGGVGERHAGTAEPAVDAVMTGHLVVPALGPAPASLEPAATALLRSLGFDGPVITDALDMRAVSDGDRVGEVAVRAVEAGADLLCLGTTAGRYDEALFAAAADALAAAVGSGRLTVARLEESAARTRRAVAAIRARRAGRPGPDAAAAHAALQDVGRRAAAAAARVRRGASAATASAAAAPDVVDLRVRLDHAAGRRATHVQAAVARRWPGARELPLDPGTGAPARRPDPGRPLVVVTREPVPGAAEHATLARLWDARRDLVVVHTGVPGAAEEWFGALPDGGPDVVLACGTGRANAAAAVDLLAGLLEARATAPAAPAPVGTPEVAP